MIEPDTNVAELVAPVRRPPIEHVVIVVPACDEAERLGPTLVALERARFQMPSHIGSTVVVVADRCSDATAELARAALPDPDAVLEVSVASAGSARCLGVAHALGAVDVPDERIWVASTDADTLVPPDWLTRQLDAAAAGFVAIAGIVTLDLARGATPALIRAFDRAYVLADDGTHQHVHAANLGFRADAYLSSGGWAALATGEDHDLWRRLSAMGPVVSDSSFSVVTDARRVGRAPDGFAADLDALSQVVA
ncbi:glycosyltransferase [Ilumatobacter sp.]|uniref:glycosyltransferase n=1 Tax=Ilumatobacter sp. TaxID=1967498 RepID=UPI003B519732